MVVALVAAILSMSTDAAVAKGGCNTRACEKRVWVKHQKKVVAPYRSILEAIARCESEGRWWIATGNGFYGGLQFALGSWRAVGGKGMPHHASKLEQMYRAVRLQRMGGWGHWPRCRYAAGV